MQAVHDYYAVHGAAIDAHHKATLAGDRARDLRMAQSGLQAAAHLGGTVRQVFTFEQIASLELLADQLTAAIDAAEAEKRSHALEAERLRAINRNR